ncbi:MAG: ParB/RepB/Spo0J family partition protein [Pyrinomonadaceae bacterium]
MARQPLGRGLSALLGETPRAAAKTEIAVNEVDIDLIDPNPQQPRTRFVESTLDELAQSIKSNGIVQPIVIRRSGDRFQIVAGERRWRAAQKAGLRRVPVTLKEISDEKLLEVALIENIQRQELNVVEEARAYRKLLDNIGFTQEELSERVGKDRSMISTALRLLKLPDQVLEFVENEMLTPGHARTLLVSNDSARQIEVAKAIVDFNLTVREAERMIKKKDAKATNDAAKEVATVKDPNVRVAETKLMRALGTNVKISPSRKDGEGKIEIEYYSATDLDRLYERLLNSQELNN